MPSGVATSVAMAATRNESRIAVYSSGEIAATLVCDYDVGLIRKVKPYFSKIALAAAERRNALQTVYPPEEHVDLDGTYTGLDGRTLTWQYASRGFYPFIPPDRAERAVYYATTELRVDEGRDVWLAIAADDDSMLWLDGRLVWASAPGDKPWYRPPYYLPDEQVASLALAEGHRRVHLSPGTHRLLLKLVNDRERTFFSVVLAP